MPGQRDELLDAGCHRLVHLELVQVEGPPGRLTVRIGRLPGGSWRETWRGGVRVG